MLLTSARRFDPLPVSLSLSTVPIYWGTMFQVPWPQGEVGSAVSGSCGSTLRHLLRKVLEVGKVFHCRMWLRHPGVWKLGRLGQLGQCIFYHFPRFKPPKTSMFCDDINQKCERGILIFIFIHFPCLHSSGISTTKISVLVFLPRTC